jgi:uncharacterized protein (UPF0261 family)
MPIYLLATCDTKGHEIEFVRDRLTTIGLAARIIDTGCVGEPQIEPDVTRAEVFHAAGTTLETMQKQGDRGAAVTRAAVGARVIVERLHASGEVDGVLGVGGSAGTTIGTAVMRALPLGLPKVMVSTLASGQVRQFVGDKDIWMLNSVVDILGLNRISRTVLSRAAEAMAGMVRFALEPIAAADRPLVAATMFGVTTPCVARAKERLEQAGCEVLVFHATGTGGQAMESLVREGLIAGVLDLTTTELADEVVGGVLSAGPGRLTAAGGQGVPQVVSVGATDMVNFHGMDTVPGAFRDRNLYRHNENVTLMRTTAEECRRIGEDLGRKIAAGKGQRVILLPARGVSAIDKEGQPFDDLAARTALFEAVRRTAGDVEVIEIDRHINDSEFATAAAEKLIELMTSAQVESVTGG